MKNEPNGKVLFNEECSICNFEINHYKKRSQLQYENSSQKGDKYLKALYVEFIDGREIKGVDAFIYVWSNTKGYGWLAKFVSLPILFTLAKVLYAFLAFILYWRFKIFNRTLSS
tara:strand:+ start:1123 stop:1464 length:342 start_codon:yes stop_codon:yes gene_type:complete